ncbi:CIC11C00000000456 [Sungouiella intermedia]|uniref:CIC11C00000000456 n=1 Tax=Sungouiella intermedia TaxID=45354 RepID=A0A1L0BJE4_9ASCO|nr:CIC11C00000000456 [[Candida] intermedia]
MPPKNLLELRPTASLASKPRLPGIKHRPTNVLSNFEDSDSDSDYGNGNGNHIRLSQTILGSHNTLKQLLSGPSSQQQEPSTPKAPKKRGRKPKVAVPPPESPLNASTTPISRLKSAAALLASPPDRKRSSIHFDDIETVPAPKKRRGRPPKAKFTAESPETPIESPQIAPKPRAKRKYTRRQKLPQSPENALEEYVEQVSHHDIDLADDSRPVPERRSSYNNRGKRVLSIGNGYVAKPHSEVSATEYYKLLDRSMPEPSQMRQLLVWCFKKMEQETDSEDGSSLSDTAKGIAKIIQQELLEDLVDGTITTSWYSRRDDKTEDRLSSKRIIRPNPLNESNKENIEIFTRKLRLLQAEKQEWHKSFDRCVAPLKSLSIVSDEVNEQKLAKHVERHNDERIVADVLGEGLLKQMQAGTDEVKESVPKKLEESVDKLYHMLYQMGQTVKLVAKVEKELLQAQVAQVVQNFMGRGYGAESTQHISCKELLRGISRLDAPKSKVTR